MIGAIQNNYYIAHSQKRKESQNFKGGFTDLITKGIKKVETGGVLVDFLFVDTLGMVLPRTYQAFTRNREELDGKLNVKNGIEELIREIFSGPSMFVIPMAFIVLSKKMFGEASKIQFKTLDSLKDSFGRLIEKNNSVKDKPKLKEEFYRNIFQEAFEDHKKVKLDKPVNIDEEVEKIVKHLSNIEKGEKSAENIYGIKRVVSDINKAHGLHLDNSHNLKLKDGLTKDTGALITDLVHYSKDIVSKVAENVELNKGEYLEKLQKSKVGGRKFILASTFLATTAFLYSVPIMYQRNKQFPGIDGLVKEENKAPQATKKENESQVNDKQKESQDKKGDKVTFGGGPKPKENIFRKLDFNGHSVPYPILAFYTIGLMLGCRWLQARNSDERREVVTRDFSGLMTIVFAVPVLRNITSTFARKASGVPISKIIKSTKSHFNPNNKPFSFENITDIHSGPSKLKNKLVDFTQNIDSHGGDLRKIFDFLGDDSKQSLNQIASDLSSKNTRVQPSGGILGLLGKSFKASKTSLSLPETNKEIIEIFKKAQENGKFKPQLEKITKELDDEKNPLVKFAEAQKSIPEAISIVAISGFLGWFLPWFNINYTRNLYIGKNKKNNNEVRTEGLKKQSEVTKLTVKKDVKNDK